MLTAEAMARQPKEGARLLARAAQQAEHAGAQQHALACLSASAHVPVVARACCVGCGKTTHLSQCERCRVARCCGIECQHSAGHVAGAQAALRGDGAVARAVTRERLKHGRARSPVTASPRGRISVESLVQG